MSINIYYNNISNGNKRALNSIGGDLISLIKDRIDLRAEYEGTIFECDSAVAANAYEQGFDGEITDIFISLEKYQGLDNEMFTVAFTANIDVVLQFNIAIEGYDYVDGGFISLGEIQRDFNELICINGNVTANIDGSDFQGEIYPFKYPMLDTYIDALSDFYDDESQYLIRFIQDSSFSGPPILDTQIKLAQKLLEEVANSHELNSMVHANVISNLESYLSKKLIPLITNEKWKNIQKAYSNSMTDKNQKIFSISDIVNGQLTPSKVLLKNLINKSFHDVTFITNLLKNVFNIDISEESTNWLNDAVAIRHDCVHRSGYNESHEPVQISRESNLTLIENIRLFVQRLERELPLKIQEKYGYDIAQQDAITTSTEDLY